MEARTSHKTLISEPQADNSLKWYELSIQPAPDGIVILSTDVSDRMQAEQEIRTLNTELESRVADRTAQLQAANQELEAFSYSVSHDLRAPLRAMEGFSSLLLTHNDGKLDPQSQHQLVRIQEAARRMGQLINDLLNLSRVTRTDFVRKQVDLSALASEIAADLHILDPQREVQFEIQAGLVVDGDRNLLRIVLENLLNNAYKFTSQCPVARIQFGVLNQGGEQVYFVRDNGVGFDMAYAAKLFIPFQRLHSVQEFSGTGIGLVTVKRIITRHGGRIWPEAQVNLGVTFFFTLRGAHE
jgi:light-regulated signal transduction histidine kinase (bacteriophytochrome)